MDAVSRRWFDGILLRPVGGEDAQAGNGNGETDRGDMGNGAV